MTRFISLSNIAGLFDRRGLLAIVSGALIALSFPSAGFSFLAWVALVPLLTALEDATLRTSFRVGFTCGIAGYAGALYWINIVITRYGNLPWALSITLYLTLVAWLAMFFGLATLFARQTELAGFKTVFTLPLAWVACDLSRSFILTGFPWAMLGHSQYRTLPLIQIADITGVFGITALIVLANVVIYRAMRAVVGAQVPYPLKSLIILLILLTGTIYYGFNRLNVPDSTTARTLKAAVIQGNIDQNVKWSPAFLEETIAIYERLTREASKGGVDLVVWPESALPFFFQDDHRHADQVRGIARELGTHILFGSPAYEERNGQRTFLNSAFVIGPDGQTIGRGDKIHLVPFGEYVPLGRFFPFISKMVVGIGDFSPGLRPVPLDVGITKVGTLVCFEGIFPELSRGYVNAGSRILVNITNDAWFGRSSAPYQHLSISVFRAVETRTPLLRAANTGITAIIDQNGHISSMTGLFSEAYRTGEVTPGRADSIYLRIGDIPAWCCLILTIIISLYCYIRQRKNTQTIGEQNVS